MKKNLHKIIVIFGPTASGKSGIAIKLAQKFNGEIISADSRQVYREMNIGTGKVDGNWNINYQAFICENIIHYLIDVADPSEDFNVSHFKKLAEEKIAEISNREKIPIICGGTAFWIDAITKNSNFPQVAPNEKLRKKLAKKTTEELLLQLQKIDPVRAKNIDSKNKVRLIRALEICQVIGRVPELSKVKCQKPNVEYDFLQIGIKTEREKLNEKIKLRLDDRFNQGMIKEVEHLHANKGISWEKMERFGLEYRNIAQYLQGKIELEEMKQKLYFDIIHYAKRQMTWLKRNAKIIWLTNLEEIEVTVKKFLN